MHNPLLHHRQLTAMLALIVCLPIIALAQDDSLGVAGFYLGPTDSVYKSLVVRRILDASQNPTVHASQAYETTYRFASPELNSYCRSVALQKKREQDEANIGSFFHHPWYYPEPKQPAPGRLHNP